MLAGASAIEVGTVNFWDPCACETLVDSLEKWCLEHRVEKISELTGGLEAVADSACDARAACASCLQLLHAGDQVGIDRQNRRVCVMSNRRRTCSLGPACGIGRPVLSISPNIRMMMPRPALSTKSTWVRSSTSLRAPSSISDLNQRLGFAQPGSQGEPAGAGDSGDVGLELKDFGCNIMASYSE